MIDDVNQGIYVGFIKDNAYSATLNRQHDHLTENRYIHILAEDKLTPNMLWPRGLGHIYF
jgi:hypothetical protein